MTEAGDVPFGLEITKGFVAKLLLAAIGFVGTILFARILGPDSFGGYYLVWTAVLIAKLPMDGLATASKKRFSEEEANRRKIAGTILALFFVIVVGVSIVAFVARDPLAGFTGLENAYVLFIVLIVPTGLFVPYQGMLAATGRVSLSIWIDFLRSLLTTPLQLGLVLLNFGAAGMAYGLSLATFVTLPLTQYVLRTAPSAPDRETLRSLWSYARHSTVSTTLWRAYSRFDIVLLGILLTPAAAANYEVALKLTLPAVLLSQVAGDGLMARVSNLHSKGEDVAPDLTNTLSFTSILAFPIFVGSAVLSRPIVTTIYGPDYAGAAPLLVGLAFYRLVRSQTYPLTEAVNGIDRPEVNVRVSAATLALNIVLGVLLTLEFGAIGVVVATVVAESLRYLILLAVVRRHIPRTDLHPSTVVEQLSAAVMMGVVVIGLHQLIAVQSWLYLSVLVSAGAVVYAVALTAMSETLRHAVLSILSESGLAEIR